MPGYFTAPATLDKDTYIRYSTELVLKGILHFKLAAGATAPIVLLGPGNTVMRTFNSDDVTVDSRIPGENLPDGYYAGTAANCKPFDFIIRNGSVPLRGPKVCICQVNLPDEKDKGSVGWKWIDYTDPAPLPIGNLLAPRVQIPFDKVPTTATRKDYWMRPLTVSNGVWSAIVEWYEDEDQNIQTGFYQLYQRGSVQGLATGNRRDGPYGRGRVGSPVCVRRGADSSKLVTAINAGVMRVHKDGRVETLWGLRLKDGSPLPRTKAGSTLTTAQKQAFTRSKYELVGDKEPNNPFCAIEDIDDPKKLWIAATDDHCVYLYDTELKKVIGIVGSDTGVMGHTTGGVGTAVRMRRPRGLAFDPITKALWVGQAWNHSLGVINRATLEYTEVWRSANNWDTAPEGNTQAINYYPYTAVQLRPTWELDGPTGVGSCHHVQQIGITSDGKFVVWASDHTRVINKFEIATGLKSLVVAVADKPFTQPNYRHTAWVSFDVNTYGKGDMKDLLAYADWQQESLLVYRMDGTTAFRPIADNVVFGTRWGRNDSVWSPGYPWCVGWGDDCLVWGDAGSECLQEMSMRQPSDVEQDLGAAQTGWNLWTSPPPGGGLSMASIYDDIGFSQLGMIQFQDMATWSDDQIDSWVLTRMPWLPGVGADYVTKVRTYIRSSQLPPGITPPPIPLPVIVSFTATPNAVLAGQAVTLAVVAENATSLSLNGVVTVFPVIIHPSETQNYVLLASNATGNASSTLEVIVIPPQQVTIGFPLATSGAVVTLDGNEASLPITVPVVDDHVYEILATEPAGATVKVDVGYQEDFPTQPGGS